MREGPFRPEHNLKNARRKPWEPNEKYLRWYRMWTVDMLSPTEIARREVVRVAHSSVYDALHRTAQWFRMQHIDHVLAIRDRQLHQHEHVMEEMMAAWQASKGAVVTTTTTEGDDESKVVTKVEVSNGNVTYINTFMAAAKAIRDMWGADAPAKSEMLVRHSEEVDGLQGGQAYASRAEAIRAAAAALELTAEAWENSPNKGLPSFPDSSQVIDTTAEPT